ncbi:xylulokinase [Saccharopolyspora erythraea NRRL 2338]|uniref:Carbohydrate kinase, FGGY n=2 Tax=Saccharopolyspora erythraea TaxID=1836 RepID=A4FNS3_SACEN|nr:FGGY family carbohydrate kinase [Saccharopolyspora erythraea]EQD85025.1 carbohydrate kinase [Saccharopolyspora erythraea D]PFG99337.1 xylulokinase [Saccharopolyspora erythraea NRRL 2338]QRK89267.1 carbohydrate kinase [Saccharopolyspora erythraea]CAM05698.1 carbohydrate kinase, FGGY [Saccharopolyspora erythraea NRRL 2338]
MGELVAGVDVATANVRVQVHDPSGELVASASRPLPQPVRSPGGRSEQDASTWWPAVRDSLRECTAALGERSSGIAALAVSATSGTVVLVDRHGDPVTPALMYDDRRAGAEALTAAEAGARRWDRIGIRPSAGSGLARIARLASDAPDDAVLACHTPDVIGWKLVGRPVATDSSHALKSGYDAVAGEWASEVFDALGVPAALLPEVVRPTTVLGAVGARAAELTGLPVGCEVRAGMTDGCAGQLACGAVDVGQFVTVLGTTLVLKGVSKELVRDPAGAVYSHLHPDGVWLPGGAANVGGSALSDVDVAELRSLDEAATERGPSGAVNYPLRGEGERFPFLAEGARGFVLGEPADRVDEYRSRLEGVAFCERLAVERLAELGAPAEGPMRTAGGGARSLAWCRIRASVLDRPVMRMQEAGTALGAALLAAAGSVHPDLSRAAAAMVPTGEVVEPEAAEVPALETSYQRFLAELRERGWL